MDHEQLESDLHYVREVVKRSDATRSPPSIYYFWAVVSLLGFAIVDYSPQHAGMFWMIAGPGGWVVSALLARAWYRKNGEISQKMSVRYGMHWAGLLGAIFLLIFGAVQGAWDMDTGAHLIMLILSLTYFFAGLHLDRALLWVSLVTAIGYLALFFLPGPVWTFTGVAAAIGLAITPFLERRSSDGDA